VKGAKRKSFLTAFIHVGNIPATKYPILKRGTMKGDFRNTPTGKLPRVIISLEAISFNSYKPNPSKFNHALPGV